MAIKKELFPKKEEIFSWVCDLTQWGHRKTGTPEGKKSAEYIASKMKEFGMNDVKIEKVPSICMTVNNCELSINNEKLECFYANGTKRGAETGRFTTDKNSQEEEFLFLGDGWEENFKDIDVKDKIIVCSIRFLKGSSNISKWFENVDSYDPKGKLQNEKNTSDIYSPNNWAGNYYRAIKGGAKGFVGILEDYMDDPYWYCEDYTDLGKAFGIKYMSIPAVWVSKSTGKTLKEKFNQNRILKGKLKMDSTYEYRDALNVSALLPGLSEDIIVVHSHHDAVFEGAVQDASGISEMLAIGKYFSSLSKEERKKTMMFVATDTHYTDYQGHQQFIKARLVEGMKMVLDIAIEHIAKEVVFDDSGKLIETGEVESRLVYITKESGMYQFVIDTFKKYNLEKSIFAQVDVGKGLDGEYEFQQDEIISDAYYFNESGVPVISTVSGPQYLFHPSDTPDRVAVDELVPIGMAFTEIALEAAGRL